MFKVTAASDVLGASSSDSNIDFQQVSGHREYMATAQWPQSSHGSPAPCNWWYLHFHSSGFQVVTDTVTGCSGAVYGHWVFSALVSTEALPAIGIESPLPVSSVTL